MFSKLGLKKGHISPQNPILQAMKALAKVTHIGINISADAGGVQHEHSCRCWNISNFTNNKDNPLKLLHTHWPASWSFANAHMSGVKEKLPQLQLQLPPSWTDALCISTTLPCQLARRRRSSVAICRNACNMLRCFMINMTAIRCVVELVHKSYNHQPTMLLQGIPESRTARFEGDVQLRR